MTDNRMSMHITCEDMADKNKQTDSRRVNFRQQSIQCVLTIDRVWMYMHTNYTVTWWGLWYK